MSQPKIKRRVGKYEVGRTIGEGTFAKVKFARNSETGEPVALKILDKEKVLKHKMAEQVWLVNSFYEKLFVSHCFTCLKRN
jgi:5'-AMP-activated protein kinase catalytic alpha subunit